MEQPPQVCVAAEVIRWLWVAVGKRAALTDDAAFLVQDERDSLSVDAMTDDGGLGQRVLDFRFGQA